MAAKIVAHPSVADRRAKGADARIATPPASHSGWVPAADRPDPVALLEEQNRPGSRIWCRSGTAG